MDVNSFSQICNDRWKENLSYQFNSSFKLLKNTFWTNNVQLGTSSMSRGNLTVLCILQQAKNGEVLDHF